MRNRYSVLLVAIYINCRSLKRLWLVLRKVRDCLNQTWQQAGQGAGSGQGFSLMRLKGAWGKAENSPQRLSTSPSLEPGILPLHGQIFGDMIKDSEMWQLPWITWVGLHLNSMYLCKEAAEKDLTHWEEKMEQREVGGCWSWREWCGHKPRHVATRKS